MSGTRRSEISKKGEQKVSEDFYDYDSRIADSFNHVTQLKQTL